MKPSLTVMDFLIILVIVALVVIPTVLLIKYNVETTTNDKGEQKLVMKPTFSTGGSSTASSNESKKQA